MRQIFCLSLLLAQSPKRAWKAYYEGNLTQAQKVFSKFATQKDPHGLIGLAYLELYFDNLSTAQKYMDSARKFLPPSFSSRPKSDWLLLNAQWAIKKQKPSLADSLLGLLKFTDPPLYTEMLLLAAENSLNQKLLTQAESLLTLANQSLKKAPSPFQTLRRIRLLAQIAHNRKEVSQAESLYQEALHLANATFGTNSLPYAMSLLDRAKFLLITGRDAQGESLAHQAATIFRPILGENHPQYVAALFNFASACVRTQKFAIAESLLKQILQGPHRPTNKT